MAQVSKYPISQDIYDRIFDAFSAIIASLNSKESVVRFFDEFLTPTERIMLAKRLSIGILVAKKYDYNDISRILRVSTTTIGNISSLYKYGKSYRKIIDGLLKDEEVEKFWLDIGEKITSIMSMSGGKAGTWKYLRDEIRKKRSSKAF